MDPRAYDGVADEPQPMIGAVLVVIAAAIALAFGLQGTPAQGTDVGVGPLIAVAISTTVVGWGIWAAVAWYFGTRLFGGPASYRTMLRAIGIAHGPGLLLALGLVPVAGTTIAIVVRLWMLASGTVAVREAQGLGWGRAVIASSVGWLMALLALVSMA